MMPVRPNNAPVVSVSAFHQYLAIEINLAILHLPAVIFHHLSTVLYITRCGPLNQLSGKNIFGKAVTVKNV
jgi:hypothetical protein